MSVRISPHTHVAGLVCEFTVKLMVLFSLAIEARSEAADSILRVRTG